MPVNKRILGGRRTQIVGRSASLFLVSLPLPCGHRIAHKVHGRLGPWGRAGTTVPKAASQSHIPALKPCCFHGVGFSFVFVFFFWGGGVVFNEGNRYLKKKNLLFRNQKIRIHRRCNHAVGFMPGWGDPAEGQTGLVLPRGELTGGRGQLSTRTKRCEGRTEAADLMGQLKSPEVTLLLRGTRRQRAEDQLPVTFPASCVPAQP